MKSTDLRIGNLVIAQVVGISKISEIHYKGGLWIEPLGKNYLVTENVESINGIPLTEDWLVRIGDFGRTEINDQDCFFNGDDVLIRIPDMRLFLHSEYDGSVWGVQHIRFVHQLQNVYFSITGQELTINP